MVYLILWSEAFGKPPVKAITSTSEGRSGSLGVSEGVYILQWGVGDQGVIVFQQRSKSGSGIRLLYCASR